MFYFLSVFLKTNFSEFRKEIEYKVKYKERLGGEEMKRVKKLRSNKNMEKKYKRRIF